MVIQLYEHYEEVLANGCDKKCQSCDLFLTKRNECIIIAQKKWEAWAEKQHAKFEKILKGE